MLLPQNTSAGEASRCSLVTEMLDHAKRQCDSAGTGRSTPAHGYACSRYSKPTSATRPPCSPSFSAQAVNINLFERSQPQSKRPRTSHSSSELRRDRQWTAYVPTEPSPVVGRPHAKSLKQAVQPVRPTIASKSSNSSASSASRAAFTSFYSSSTSSLESLGTSPATSVESFPTLPDTDFAESKPGVFEKVAMGRTQPSRVRPLSFQKITQITGNVGQTTKGLPAMGTPPNAAPPRMSMSTARGSVDARRCDSNIARHEDASAPSQYYQDPSARQKLRQCLASAQNFEEALQFGFPPSPKALVHVQRIQPEFSNNHVHSFLNSSDFFDTSSQFGDKPYGEYESDLSDDEVSSGSTSGRSRYITFPDQAFDPSSKHPHRMSMSSRRSGALHRKDLDSGLFGQREMTLRLTLTKPVVRDSDVNGSMRQESLHRRQQGSPNALGGPLGEATATDKANAGPMRGLMRRLKTR